VFVKPLILKEEALLLFDKGSKWRRKQKPEKIELIYLPYYSFEILVLINNKEKEVFLSVDGIQGEFRFLETKHLEFTEKTKNLCFKFTIGREEATKRMRDEYQWILVKGNNDRKIRVKVNRIKDTKEFFYPYWIAYYKRINGYEFKTIDAISGKFTGVKMQRTFLKAFSQQT